ncbi:MAG: TonB-dependent receptor [Deltaproteobacteria bacterium]|nr:TonB-dependent receptor [Deltaproteobacteria bacterium]
MNCRNGKPKLITSCSQTCHCFVVFPILLLLLMSLPALASGDTSNLKKEEPQTGVKKNKENNHKRKKSRTGRKLESMGEILVKAKRERPLTGSVDFFSKDDIRKTGGGTAADVLAELPSMYLVPNSRGDLNIMVRGFEQKQVSVMIDGLPVYLPYDGGFDLSLVPQGMVDSISVIKGTGPITFGPNSLGGAINIGTIPPGKGPVASARVQGGRLGDISFGGSHSYKVSNFSYSLGFDMSRSNGFPLPQSFSATTNEDGGTRNNSDRKTTDILGAASVSITPEHELFAKVYYIDAQKGVPPLARQGRARYWRFTYWRNLLTFLGHRGVYLGKKLELEELAFFRMNKNLLDSFDDDSYKTQESKKAFHSTYDDWSAGGRIRLNSRLDTGAGPIFFRTWLQASHDMHRERPDRGKPLTTRSRTISTLVGEGKWMPWAWLALTSGIQFDMEDLNHEDISTGIGPLVSAGIKPMDRLNLKFTAARRMRFPTLKERYSSALGKRKPNPNLKPETAWHMGLDLGIRINKWLRLVVSGFDSEVDHIIEDVTTEDGLLQLQNIEKARLAGLEGRLVLIPAKWIEIRAGYCYLYARQLEPVKDKLEYRPKHKARAGLWLEPIKGLRLGTWLDVVSGTYYRNPDSNDFEQLDHMFLVGAKLTLLSTRGARFWVRVSNLLDYEYESSYGFPGPGREFWTGVSLALDK